MPASLKVHVAGWSTLRAQGPETRSWLNGLVTCDVDLVVGDQGAWGLLLTKRGKIICDLTLLPAEDGVWLGSGADADELFELLDSYLVMEDVDLQRVSGYTWITLHGEGALAAARDGVVAEIAAEVAWTSTEGAALLVPEASVAATLELLAERFSAQVLDADQWHAYRVREGLPAFGTDFGSDDNPHEAALDRRTISWSKGCYLGQEVVCMQDMRGKVKRRLVRLSSGTRRPPEPGTPVTNADGRSVGSITSAAPGEAGGFVAIASVQAPHFEPGCQVRVGDAELEVLALLPAS